MLQPSTSDPAAASEAGDTRLNAKAGLRPVTLDPSWRAGRKLEEARKQLGLTLQEVSDRIRVRREFLEALEAMNVKLLPGKAYTLAFLKSYATALGLDDKAIVEQFQDECALSREDATKQIRDPSSRPNPRRPWMAAAAILAAAGAFVLWRAVTSPDGSEVAQQAQQNTGIVSTEISAASDPSAETRIVEIRAITPSWLEARGPDGTVFLSRNLDAGDVYRPDASPGWTLHARDGGAFEMFVNGVSAGPLGPPGNPVLGRPIDEIEPLTQAGTPRTGG
jgi:cytoskeleton protein RodZ